MSRNNNPPKHRNISRRTFVSWDDMWSKQAAFAVVKKVMKCGSEFLNLTTKEGPHRSTDIQVVSYDHTPDQTDIYVCHTPDWEAEFEDYPRLRVTIQSDGTMKVIIEGSGENVKVERRNA